MERKKPGRPSRGPRVQVAFRIPEPFRDVAFARAEALGMTFNDYVTWLIEQDTSVQAYAQGALPLAS